MLCSSNFRIRREAPHNFLLISLSIFHDKHTSQEVQKFGLAQDGTKWDAVVYSDKSFQSDYSERLTMLFLILSFHLSLVLLRLRFLRGCHEHFD